MRDVFETDVECRLDTRGALFEAGREQLGARETLVAQMREVQARHTYVQRIERILELVPRLAGRLRRPSRHWRPNEPDSSAEHTPPDSGAPRSQSFRFAFDHFVQTGGRTVVESGTIRSFVHGALPGCGEDDPRVVAAGPAGDVGLGGRVLQPRRRDQPRAPAT